MKFFKGREQRRSSNAKKANADGFLDSLIGIDKEDLEVREVPYREML